MKIGYMGIPGSFSEMAAEAIMDAMNWDRSKMEFVPLVCAENILQALKKKEIDYGVLAVRNTTVGPVQEFIDSFSNVPHVMHYEYALPVHHCLFKLPSVPMGSLTAVSSHPQALGQTRNTRMKHFAWMQENEIEDTAIGARWLADGTLPPETAVICSRNGGRLWKLDLIAENIEDSVTNQTIFQLISLYTKSY